MRLGLLLHALGTKERVLLETHFVFYDHGRDSHALKRTHVVHKPLGASTRIPIKDDGLGGDLHDFLDGRKTTGEVHELDVGLAFERGVAERTHPHAVKRSHQSRHRIWHARVFHHEAVETIRRLDDAQEGLESQQPTQGPTSLIWRAPELSQASLQRRGRDAPRIGHLHKLASPARQQLHHFGPHHTLRPLNPVVSMDHVVRVQGQQILAIGKRVLTHDARHVCQTCVYPLTRCVGQKRHALVGRDGLVAHEADHHLAELGGFRDHVEDALVQNVRGDRNVCDLCHVILPYASWLATSSSCLRTR